MKGNDDIIRTAGLIKIYSAGEAQVEALKGIDLVIRRGEFTAIMGASGSGKSTLMNILGCLDVPTAGDYYLEETRVNTLSRDELSEIRNRKIGFVFQGFNLLARTSALDNAELPLLYSRIHQDKDTKKIAMQALEQVGLSDRMHHFPNQLSGGQQQRVAIARALVNNPSLILADEPTGNLDTKTSVEIIALFQELNDQGITVVIVTHENDIAEYTKRIIEFRDGLVLRDHKNARPRNA